ncbi:MAG: four helix bundle protein [Paludibacter sp.]|nr:four helix bundle protein [Paludibacter sp.]
MADTLNLIKYLMQSDVSFVTNNEQQTTNNKQQTTNNKTMSTWKSFEEIEVWQLAREFCNHIFKIMQYEGLKHDYALKDQINRSSGSVMDNIAEGFGRGGTKEFINFLSIAKGSTDESRSQLHRIFDRKYISEDEYQKLCNKTNEIANKIGGLIAYLKKSNYKGTKFK